METNHKCLCGKTANNQCGNCNIERYCSRECQIEDWKNHKIQCFEDQEIECIMNECFESIGKNSMNLFKMARNEGQRGAFVSLLKNMDRLILFKDTIPFVFLTVKELNEQNLNIPSLEALINNYDLKSQVVICLGCNKRNYKCYVLKNDVCKRSKRNKRDPGAVLRVGS